MSDAPPGETTVRRVLAVAPDAERTGAAPWLRDLLVWARAEHDVTIELVVLEDGPLLDELAALGPVHLAPSPLATFASVAHALHRPRWAGAARRRWLSRALAATGPADVVLAGSPATAAALRRHQDRLPPVVVHVQEHGAGATPVPGALDGTCLVVAPTAAALEQAAQPPGAGGLGAPRHRLRLHTGPVDPPPRHPRPDRDDSVLLVGCGPIGWRSGTDLFVALAAAVGPCVGGRTVRFSWIGGPDDDGTDRDVVDDIALRGLGDVVRLPGDLPDRADRLAAADLLVVTGRDDAYPIAAVEAALAGTPVVGFRPGTALLGAAGHDGLRVDRLDVDALAAEVLSVLTSPDGGRLLAGDLARAAAAATTPLAATALWADIEAAVAASDPSAGGPR